MTEKSGETVSGIHLQETQILMTPAAAGAHDTPCLLLAEIDSIYILQLSQLCGGYIYKGGQVYEVQKKWQ